VTRSHLDERFAGRDPDRSVWVPYYLPHWSSRGASEATWEVRDGELHLTIHRFRDPALVEEFSAERVPLDVTRFHRYGVDWRPEGLTFTIDGAVVRRVRQSPAYPMQLMIGVFDFPAKATGDDEPVPELVVSHVTGRP
jgi:hypothetical protein